MTDLSANVSGIADSMQGMKASQDGKIRQLSLPFAQTRTNCLGALMTILILTDEYDHGRPDSKGNCRVAVPVKLHESSKRCA